MKKVLSVFLTLAMLLSVAVFGQAEETKTLTILWSSDNNDTIIMNELIAEYEAMTPGVKIELVDIPSDDILSKLMLAVSGGEAPAMVRIEQSPLKKAHEALDDLSKYLDNIDELTAQYVPAIKEYYCANGKVCGFPMTLTANGLMINKTAFDKAGVAYPTTPDDIWTWDEFVEALKTVMEKGDVKYGLAIDNATHRWSTILYEFDGRYTDENGIALNSPETIEAMEFTKSMFDQGIAVREPWYGGESAGSLFQSGQVAAQFTGSWNIGSYNDNIKDFEWCVVYNPIAKCRSTVPGGNNLCLCANTGVEQESADFIKWVCAPEQNARFALFVNCISPCVANASLDYSARKDDFAIFANELANCNPKAAFDWCQDVVNASTPEMKEAWQQYLEGIFTVEEAIDYIGSAIADK